MVSADNLNFDILKLIFSHIPESPSRDLASVALVSRSFLAGVTPRLYSTLLFLPRHAKRYRQQISPFRVILLHPYLAVHVKYVDIRAAPKSKSQIHPEYLRDCTEAIKLSRNLVSFKCTLATLVWSFLLSLQGKEHLRDIRLQANFTPDQAVKLVGIKGLSNLILENPSWSVVDSLPSWIQSMKGTLTGLTFYMASELSRYILDPVLRELPNLLGFHCIGCPHLDQPAILSLVPLVPALESLSFTAGETPPSPTPGDAVLCHLQHLALDARISCTSSSVALINLLAPFKASPITSFILKLPDRRVPNEEAFIKDLLSSHAPALTRVAFVNCSVAYSSLSAICSRCPRLERLDIPVPVKEFTQFSNSLYCSSSLSILVDVGNSHVEHGPQISLTPSHVRILMRTVVSLKKVVSDRKTWTRLKSSYSDEMTLSLERNLPSAALWFMPRDQIF